MVTVKRKSNLAHKIAAPEVGTVFRRLSPRFKSPVVCADNPDTMLSAGIMLGALLVIAVAITTAWRDSTADYKKHISLFGNGDDG